MEHEIEARWPPSCRTSLVGSGPRALLQDHMNAGGSDVPIVLRRRAVERACGSLGARGLGFLSGALTQQWFCPLSSLETAHPEHSSYCIDELPQPLGGPGPPHLPEGSFLFIFWEVTSLGPSPLAVTLGTLPWTLAHSHLGCKLNPKE